jgi:hypothetical protein
MPTGPKGQKRPGDVIGNDIEVACIATRETPPNHTDAVCAYGPALRCSPRRASCPHGEFASVILSFKN